MDLLRWFRFPWAAGVPWEQATRAEARDFCRWMQIADKPARALADGPSGGPRFRAGAGDGERGDREAVAGPGYAAATAAHCETVLRGVLRLPPGGRDRADGQPVPAGPERTAGRMRITTRWSRSGTSGPGCYRPRAAERIPRHIPDELFNELFAPLGSHRDRALVAFWVSTGARAAELLGAAPRGMPTRASSWSRWSARDRGRCSSCRRRRTRSCGCGSTRSRCTAWCLAGRDDPVWWTLRRPFRPLSYHAARAMFTRAERVAGRELVAARPAALRPPTGWHGTRRCRSPTCSGSWATRTCPPLRFTSRPRRTT